MFPHLKSILGLLLCIWIGEVANASESQISLDLEAFNDTAWVTTYQDIAHAEFNTVAGDIINLGIKEHPSWLRMNVPPTSGDMFLQIESPAIDSLFFYQFDGESLLSSDSTGTAYPFSSRQVESPLFLFKLHTSGDTTTVYLRIQSGKQVIALANIDTELKHLQKQNEVNIFFGIYSGLMLVMFLYNLFVYFSVRDRSYLFYVGYIVFVGLTQLVLNGYGSQYFWPDHPWLNVRSVHFSGVTSGIATILFAGHFLQVRRNAKWLLQLMRFYTVLYIIAAVAAIAGYFQFSFNLINFSAMFSLILLVGAIVIYRRGYKPAFFFLAAWSFFLVGVAVFVMKDYGIVPYNNVARFALPVGSALEVVLLSLALADRINQLKREKEKEQEERVKVLKENERIITQQNVLLEKKVNERTQELATSNQELNSTLTELRSAQAQLVDAEKMASLGQMTAGIAHELNNPINFVSSNILPLRRDIDDLYKVLELYEKASVDETSAQAHLQEAQALSKELEVDFLRQEIDQLLKGISDGASRTAEIVKGLRIFSRLDEDALKKADVNECIRSTVVILKSAIKSHSPVIQDLDVSLPEINCYPGKLNQVFMNIIGNALQAVAESNKPFDEREVRIETSFDDENLYVKIKDNGIGMEEGVKSKIFDPFFTTKKVGEGTGLGLSIVLGIINDHQGKIDVHSAPKEGTEFIITLSRSL